MEIKTHLINRIKIAEVSATHMLINTTEDGLDLLGNLYYQGFDKVIIHAQNINPDFFDLKTGMAGEILQKFSNYRMPLVIVGDLSNYTNKSIKDFIYESNNGKQVNFLDSLTAALHKLGHS